MVDTAGTLTKAAEVLKERGAKKVIAYCTHPVLSGPAIDRITNSPLDELVVTDTIPLTEAARACPKIRVLSCASLLAEWFISLSHRDGGRATYGRTELSQRWQWLNMDERLAYVAR